MNEKTAQSQKLRILIVDDEEYMLDIIKALLIQIGNFELDFASSGRTAAKKLLAQQYDLLITDNLMPEVSGSDLVEFWRRRERTKEHTEGVKIKILMLTSVIDDIPEDIKDSIDAHLAKGCTVEELSNVLKICLPQIE